MPRQYTVQFGNVAVAAAIQDLFEVRPAANKPLEIQGYVVTQVGNSDVGDSLEQLIRLQFIRGYTASGSGGGTPTPQPSSPADAAAGFGADTNNTTVANTGTVVTLHEDAFNARMQSPFWWPPGRGLWVSAAESSIVVRSSAPASSITLSGTLYVAEYP